jgi:hypothetical protein
LKIHIFKKAKATQQQNILCIFALSDLLNGREKRGGIYKILKVMMSDGHKTFARFFSCVPLRRADARAAECLHVLKI